MWSRVLRAAKPSKSALFGGVTLTAGLGFAATSFVGAPASCHGTHQQHGHGEQDARIGILEQRLAQLEGDMSTRYGVKRTSGEGDAVFSWDEELTAAFPAEARLHEVDMHGGFNEDSNTGKVYTGIPGAGLFEISADLKEWRKLGDDPRLLDNIHGLVVFESGGKTKIAVAQNDDQRVLILDLNGSVQQQLNKPRGGEFNFGEANAYYSERRHQTDSVFACTDVTFLDGKLYVSTGYCDGDFIVTAEQTKAGKWQWGPVAWGGKGEGAGKFQTAHGVTAYDDHIYVANREAFQVVKFSKDGHLVEVLPDIPDGSRICNISRAEKHEYFVMNALAPIQSTAPRTAPIYAHTGDRLVATIDPGSLGIPVLKHLHHVWPHYVNDELYLLVHGWRDGKFAVLKHEPAHGKQEQK